MTKIAVVAPVHIQVSDEWARSLELVSEKANADVIIVDDSDGRVSLPSSFKVFGYAAQEQYLGDLYPFFEQFHKSSSCKAFGLLYAYREEYDVVMVIDSDCMVPPNFIVDHVSALTTFQEEWINPIEATGFYSRGFPSNNRKDQRPQAHMGLWEGNLDLSGYDRFVSTVSEPTTLPPISGVARGFIPFSGMNLSMWHGAIPGYLFLPNAEYGDCILRRHDDIWGGYIFQHFLRKRHAVMTYGYPYVQHVSKVDAEEDYHAELGACTLEDEFYREVDNAMRSVKPDSYESMLKQFTEAIDRLPANNVLKVFAPAFFFWSEALS